MRIGVFGGSFHPPHVGHAMVAAWLKWTDQVDEVWLVPTAQHPFGKALAPVDLRLAWCRALADELGDWCRVDPIERDLGGVSYTIRTLDALAARHPDHRIRLVLGSDQLAGLDAWREPERIRARYAPLIVGRAGHAGVDGVPTFPEVSSTAVRARLAAGEDVDAWVTAGVRAAITGWTAWG